MKKITFILFTLFCSLGYAQTFTDSGGPYDMQNGNGATTATCDTADALTLPLAVTGVGTLGGVNSFQSVTLNISHTWSDDIVVSLQDPSGAITVLLVDDKGGQTNGFNITLESDAAALPDGGADGPALTGTFAPQESFSAFTGADADGTWNLLVCDDANGDVGTVDSWSITFAPTPTCLPVVDLATTAIMTTSVTIEWSVGGTETAWEYALLGEGSTEPASGTPYASTSYDATVTPGTVYDFYVRADCTGGDYSSWSKITFTSAFETPECATTPFPADAAVDVPVGPLTFTWTAPAAGPAPTSYNLYVYDNANGDNPTLVGNFTEASADLVINAYETDIYWGIEPVNGTATATGCDVWVFTTGEAPVGAICENSIEVTSLPYTTSDDTSNYIDDYGTADRPPLTGAQYTNGTGSANYLTGDDVVYSFTPVQDGVFNFELILPTSDWYGFWLFEGCAPFTSVVAYHTATSGATRSLPEIDLIGGTTYYVVISTFPAPQSTPYTLNITENTCTNATVEYTVVSDCDNSGGFNIEVNVTDLGTATDITLSDDQSSTPQSVTQTGVYTFGPYVNGTDVVITVSDDNDANCSQNSSALTQALCPPANDACSTATVLTTLPFTASEDALGATNNDGFISSCGFGMNDGVWYTFTPTSDGTVNIEITNSVGSDLELAIYSGSCGTFTCVDSVDSGGTEVDESLMAVNVVTGTQYFINVGHYSSSTNSSEGTFDISISGSVTLSIESIGAENTFSYFPNPVKGTLNLKAQNNIQNVAIYNMLGQEVLRNMPNALESNVDMSSLQTGTYFVKVTIQDRTQTVKVIKN